MSNNISFETGLKAFTINGDANRKIYFDPNDIGIIDRLEAAAMAIKAKADEMGTQESDTDARTTIRELDAYARGVPFARLRYSVRQSLLCFAHAVRFPADYFVSGSRVAPDPARNGRCDRCRAEASGEIPG